MDVDKRLKVPYYKKCRTLNEKRLRLAVTHTKKWNQMKFLWFVGGIQVRTANVGNFGGGGFLSGTLPPPGKPQKPSKKKICNMRACFVFPCEVSRIFNFFLVCLSRKLASGWFFFCCCCFFLFFFFFFEQNPRQLTFNIFVQTIRHQQLH